MKNETLNFDTANGATTAYVALPEEANSNNRAIIIIHEYWGLNDHIKDIAGRYASEGFTAVAPDLYRGKTAKTPDEATKLMNALELEDGLETIAKTITTATEKYNRRRHFFRWQKSGCLRLFCGLRIRSAGKFKKF